MLIDWFTVGAQVLNFVILVWLMKRYLYVPILNAIDAREKRIADELADAAAKQEEARAERDRFQQKNEAFERQQAERMRKAADEVATERKRLLDEAHAAADVLGATRREALERDARQLGDAITRRTQEEVFAIARKVLADLAGASLEERMAEVFTRKVREMSGEPRETLANALGTAADPSVVRSAFAMPDGQRAAIQKALNESFSADVPLRFETVPGLVGGIELAIDGHRMAWSITDYLASLEASVRDLLDRPDVADSSPAVTADPPAAPSHQ